jgi:hypothetical protein
MFCRIGRQIGADYTQFFRRNDGTAKNGRYTAAGDDFKPIQAAFTPTAKRACDYTE